jgi:thioredoxin reductase
MGLIRNAIEQGCQAIGSISEYLNSLPEGEDLLDVLIVGAGPAGIAATLGAMESGIRHRTIEQHAFGGTPANFPRGKIVMTSPAELPLVGKVTFRETTKEKLVGFWEKVRNETGMLVSYGERLLEVERDEHGLVVKTSEGRYRTRSVLLAIGRRGTPRKLGVPGEDLEKVQYALLDPADYVDRRVIVVGGGDSALEAAASIAEEQGAEVTLAYRSEAFTRAKKKNRQTVERLVGEARMNVMMETELESIESGSVTVSTPTGSRALANDAVIVCAGGILPDGLLREMGILIETKYGTA